MVRSDRMPWRFAARAAALLAPVLLGACEFNTTAITPPAPKVVVHAVLNPAFSQQMVLLERTLTGTVTLGTGGGFDFRNPVVTGGGIPISGASVVVTSHSTGRQWTGTEEPAGGGVYLLDTGAGAELVPGHRYGLRIETPDGEVVTDETLMPQAVPDRLTSLRLFDRDTDTLSLAWSQAAGARSYALRVDTPTGPFHFFTDGLSLKLPGSIRNLFTLGIPRVFIPGFRQLVTLSAVDANYFNYYRSRNDAFTGSGLISSVVGGIGLFGSMVNLELRAVDVVAPVDELPEGEYLRARGSGPERILLWIEQPATDLVPAVVTGRHTAPERNEPGGIIGTFAGSSISLSLLRGQLFGDELATFTGRSFPDSLVGTLSGAEVMYIRRP